MLDKQQWAATAQFPALDSIVSAVGRLSHFCLAAKPTAEAVSDSQRVWSGCVKSLRSCGVVMWFTCDSPVCLAGWKDIGFMLGNVFSAGELGFMEACGSGAVVVRWSQALKCVVSRQTSTDPLRAWCHESRSEQNHDTNNTSVRGRDEREAQLCFLSSKSAY